MSTGHEPQQQPQQRDEATHRDEPKQRAEEARNNLDKAIRAEDQPIENRAPGAPFAIVGLAYLVVLALALLTIAILLYWIW